VLEKALAGTEETLLKVRSEAVQNVSVAEAGQARAKEELAAKMNQARLSVEAAKADAAKVAEKTRMDAEALVVAVRAESAAKVVSLERSLGQVKSDADIKLRDARIKMEFQEKVILAMEQEKQHLSGTKDQTEQKAALAKLVSDKEELTVKLNQTEAKVEEIKNEALKLVEKVKVDADLLVTEVRSASAVKISALEKSLADALANTSPASMLVKGKDKPDAKIQELTTKVDFLQKVIMAMEQEKRLKYGTPEELESIKTEAQASIEKVQHDALKQVEKSKADAEALVASVRSASALKIADTGKVSSTASAQINPETDAKIQELKTKVESQQNIISLMERERRQMFGLQQRLATLEKEADDAVGKSKAEASGLILKANADADARVKLAQDNATEVINKMKEEYAAMIAQIKADADARVIKSHDEARQQILQALTEAKNSVADFQNNEGRKELKVRPVLQKTNDDEIFP
jgi:hypothetical protein